MAPPLPQPPRPRSLVLAAVAALALAAAGVALPGLAPERPLGPDLVPTAPDDAGPAVELAALDLHPMGRHALEVQVSLASRDGGTHDDLTVLVEARGPGDQPLDAHWPGPVDVPADGAWSMTVTLVAEDVVAGMDHVQVQVGGEGGTTMLP